MGGQCLRAGRRRLVRPGRESREQRGADALLRRHARGTQTPPRHRAQLPQRHRSQARRSGASRQGRRAGRNTLVRRHRADPRGRKRPGRIAGDHQHDQQERRAPRARPVRGQPAPVGDLRRLQDRGRQQPGGAGHAVPGVPRSAAGTQRGHARQADHLQAVRPLRAVAAGGAVPGDQHGAGPRRRVAAAAPRPAARRPGQGRQRHPGGRCGHGGGDCHGRRHRNLRRPAAYPARAVQCPPGRSRRWPRRQWRRHGSSRGNAAVGQ